MKKRLYDVNDEEFFLGCCVNSVTGDNELRNGKVVEIYDNENKVAVFWPKLPEAPTSIANYRVLQDSHRVHCPETLEII